MAHQGKINHYKVMQLRKKKVLIIIKCIRIYMKILGFNLTQN